MFVLLHACSVCGVERDMAHIYSMNKFFPFLHSFSDWRSRGGERGPFFFWVGIKAAEAMMVFHLNSSFFDQFVFVASQQSVKRVYVHM